MKIIRCKNCGMSLEVNEGEFIKACPICDTKNLVSKAEEVHSVDKFYDADQYHLDTPSHAQNHVFVDRVEEEKKERQRMTFQVNQDNGNPQQQKMVKMIVITLFVMVFIFFFITLIMGNVL